MNNRSTPEIRVLYYGGGWPTNIGNAFIDFGAMAILRAAFSDARISIASEMPPWFLKFAMQLPRTDVPRGLLSRAPGLRWLFKARNASGFMDNAFDMAKVTVCDLAVFSGMAMCEEFIQVNGSTVLRLAERRIPILLLGTGGLTYEKTEVKKFRDFLHKLKPIGFISRDDRSFDLYSDAVNVSHRGIDCGFFVSQSFTPFKLDLPDYAVVNFDTHQEPDLNLNGLLRIDAHHECFGPVPFRYVQKPRTLISDLPQDYLTLYANATEVHSDRIHACVATLAYGNKARLYGETPRSLLFNAIGAENIGLELVKADMHMFAKKKIEQVELVRKIVTEALKLNA